MALAENTTMSLTIAAGALIVVSALTVASGSAPAAATSHYVASAGTQQALRPAPLRTPTEASRTGMIRSLNVGAAPTAAPSAAHNSQHILASSTKEWDTQRAIGSEPASRTPTALLVGFAAAVGSVLAALLSRSRGALPNAQEVQPFGTDFQSAEQTRLLPNVAMMSTTGAATESDAASTAAAPVADVIVIGAGISGLCAALALSQAGKSVVVLESGDGVGGRVRTDFHEGYILDRGFQIFLTGYPEAKQVLDYEELNLQKFYPGAFVRWNEGFHRVADPFRRPVDGALSLLPTHPIGDIFDKLRVGLLRLNTFTSSWDGLLTREEVSTEQRLKDLGFSDAMIDRFFRPFLGGIFFDNKLQVSSRLLDFVIRTLAVGDNCLPAKGIGQVPEQLAGKLPNGSIRLNSEVQAVDSKEVRVQGEDGKEIVLTAGDAVIVATEGPTAAQLVGPRAYSAAEKAGTTELPNMLCKDTASPNGTVCLYFGVDSLPDGYAEPVLYLDGEGKRLLNNMCFPSTVAPTYAPAGKHLVSVSLVGAYLATSDEDLIELVKKDVAAWFGAGYAEKLDFLRLYRIPFSQPNQEAPTNLKREVRMGKSVYVCGDHRDSATLQGAMVSGRRAAEAVLQDA